MQGLCIYWDMLQNNTVRLPHDSTAQPDPPVDGEEDLLTGLDPASAAARHACILQPMTATVDLSSQKELAVEHGGVMTTHLRCAVTCGRVGLCLTQQQLHDAPLLLNRVLLWQLRNTYAAQRPPSLLWARVEEGLMTRSAYWRCGGVAGLLTLACGWLIGQI